MPKLYRTYEVYMVYVEEDKCDGCQECNNYCPVNVFDVFHKAYPVRPQNCLGCRTCVAVCKSKAIVITSTFALGMKARLDDPQSFLHSAFYNFAD